jgi:S1-C subfamily serine protease
MRKFIAALGGVLLAAGCGYPATEIKPVEVKQAIQVPEGTHAKPIMLTHVVFKIPRGEDLGRRLGGGNCRAVRDRINWYGEHMRLSGEEDEFKIAFIEIMKQANYPAVGMATSLFDEEPGSSAELRVAAVIDKLQAEPCFNKDDHHDYNYASGTAAVRVNWQVFDVLAGRVVYKVTTEGFFHTEQSQTGGADPLVINAFQVAVTNLQADPEFNALVMGKSPSVQSDTQSQPLIRIRAATQPPASIPDAQAAVISIKVALGHGSGFIISPDGYALTDQHVLGDARFVKAILASGREVPAEVVRGDTGRDVALIKLGEGNLPALKLRLDSEPNVGDEVYAIGTPLELELANTVTHGIISAYRNDNGFKFIQSDASIHHGNSGGPLVDRSAAVVGLSEASFSPVQGEPGAPIYLFTPITDVLRRLNVQVETPEQSFHMQ